MNHDLLMILYGAVVGIGSSFLTTLFQSWLERREYERRRKEEQKTKLQFIYIPTLKEVNELLRENIANETEIKISGLKFEIQLWSIFRIIPVLLIFGGVVYLTYWMNDPLIYLAVAAIVAFILTYAITKIVKP